jgi:hypothetical protein
MDSVAMSKKKHRQRRLRGFCKLTHREGAFVDSHIIPEALTRPSMRGNPMFQYGDSGRPTRRWSSWYDPTLVTADGEKYLSDLDSWAITQLRQHKLVWSGWGDEASLGRIHTPINSFLGVRTIDGIDTRRLRRFFLSLLWRAAASDRYELKQIAVPPQDLEELRQAVVGLDEPPLDFYPIQLTQLSTKGFMHNQTPIPDVKYAPNLEDLEAPPYELPTFRFYMDGLIAHVHRSLPAAYGAKVLGNLVIGGAEKSLVLSTVTFAESLQASEMATILREFEG